MNNCCKICGGFVSIPDCVDRKCRCHKKPQGLEEEVLLYDIVKNGLSQARLDERKKFTEQLTELEGKLEQGQKIGESLYRPFNVTEVLELIKELKENL